MTPSGRQNLDQLIDQSEQFETRWEERQSGGEPQRDKLLGDLTEFVRVCATHGVFIPLGSPDRRALRSILDRWNSRLREAGVQAGEELAEYDPKAGVALEGPCPYPGLNAYTAKQRGTFFGREEEINRAAKHFETAGNRIWLIYGSSGSGKSSLALAGILPRLQDSHKGSWLFAPPFTPGAQPNLALAKAVARAIRQPKRAPEIERGLADAPDDALAFLATVCKGRPLTLLVDQFEELLTLCRDTNEQGRFARIICALSDPETSVEGFTAHVLLTLRTDHLGRFEHADALAPLHRRLIGEHNYDQLSTIRFADIRRAIKEPADQLGLRFVPPDLIDRLANQAAGLANGLPLLQFALQRLWDTRPVNSDGKPLDLITQEMVDSLPDVQGALGKVAAHCFEAFSEPQRRACERLLQELVVLDENFEEPLRRRRGERELIEELQAKARHRTEDIKRVINDFVDERLLRRFGVGRTSQLEIAHEALLRHWPHLRELLTGADAKDRLHLVKQIGRESAEWADRGCHDDELRLHGGRLQRAVEYAEDGWFADKNARAYIEACQRREEENLRRDQEVLEQRERADAAERAQQEALAKAAQERERSARAAADKRAAEETAKAERALAEAALERERAARATADKAEALAEVAQQRARAAHADADAAAAREQAALAAAAMADLRLAQAAADASETQRRAAEAAARTAKRIARLTTLGLAAASMLALLAGGAGLYATLARQDADAQRHRAEQRLKLATDSAESLVSFVAKDLSRVQGIQTTTVRRILDVAQNSFERLSSDDRDDSTFDASRAAMMSEFGQTYLKIGDLEQASNDYSQSLRIYRRLAGKEANTILWQRGIADQIDNIGVVLQQQGKYNEARANFNQALEIRLNIASS